MSHVILIHYPDDTGHIAYRLQSSLSTHFGHDQITGSIDDLVKPGQDYTEIIPTLVSKSDFVVVLIGDQFVGDWLRDSVNLNTFTLNTALNIGVNHVLPVLVDGAVMPPADLLPEPLQGLTRRKSVTLGSASFTADVDAIIEQLEGILPKVSSQPIDEFTFDTIDDKDVPEVAYTYDPFTGGRVDDDAPKNKNDAGAGGLLDRDGALFVRALTFPYESDPDWFKKCLVLAGVNLIPIVGSLISVGYVMRAARRVYDGQPGLPQWDDWSGDLGQGFMVFLGLSLASIVFMVGLSLVSAVLQLVLGDAGGILAGLIFLVAGLPLALYSFSAIARFMRSNQFSAFFNFGVIYHDIRYTVPANLGFFGHAILYVLVLGIGIGIGYSLCFLPGLFVAAAGGLGYAYLLATWSEILLQNDTDRLDWRS